MSQYVTGTANWHQNLKLILPTHFRMSRTFFLERVVFFAVGQRNFCFAVVQQRTQPRGAKKEAKNSAKRK